MKEKKGTLQTPFLSFNQKMLGSPPYAGKNKASGTSQGLQVRGWAWSGRTSWSYQPSFGPNSVKGLKADGLPVTCVNVALSSSPSPSHRCCPSSFLLSTEATIFPEGIKEEAMGPSLPLCLSPGALDRDMTPRKVHCCCLVGG